MEKYFYTKISSNYIVIIFSDFMDGTEKQTEDKYKYENHGTF